MYVAISPFAAYESAKEERERKEETTKLREGVEAGDLESSKKCVAGTCGFYDAFDSQCQAAENVINAYQKESELDLDKQVLLISAHKLMAQKYKINNSPDERRIHLMSIVQLAHSQELWDYLCNANFESRRIIQEKLNETVVDLLVLDQGIRVADDPYQAFVCDFTPYQKVVDLTNVGNSGDPKSPCEDAALGWGRQARNKLKESIENGDLAAAESCLLECEKIVENITEYGKPAWMLDGDVKKLRRLSADRIISAYENKPDLDSHQQKVLGESRTLSLKKYD